MQLHIIGNQEFNPKLINYLSVLKPAATTILLAPTVTDLKDIIQVTVQDLALKKVLLLQHKNILLHPSDPYKRPRTIVETSNNFAGYKNGIFETYFTGIIDEDSYFHLHPYLARIYNELPLDNKVKKSIIKESNIRNLFSLTFTFDSYSIFRLNRHGLKVRNEILRYFVTIEDHLEQIIENSPEFALRLVSFLKGNIFLLRNLHSEIFEKLNALIQQQEKEGKDEFFNLFDIFEFPEIFLEDIFSEIKDSLFKIQSAYNNRGNNSDDYDYPDYFFD